MHFTYMHRSPLRTLAPIAATVMVIKLRNIYAPNSCSSEGLSKNFLAEAVAKASPSVVNIVSNTNRAVIILQSSGSGFIIDDGYVVTNAHVVQNKGLKGKVDITLWDGRRLSGAVHSMDKVADIALIKLDKNHTKLPISKLGNSSDLKPGEFVAALGSPLTLNNSVTFGIISTVSRNGSELGMGKKGQDYIQTDAPINVGNSGGPLINMDGEVIGINTMKLSNSDGISFAIPIDVAKNVISHLKTGKEMVRPYIGIKFVGLRTLSMEPKVFVTFVDPGSPADIAGLAEGDEIVSINGKTVHSTRDIVSVIVNLNAEDRNYALNLDVIRKSGESAEVTVYPSFHN